MLVCPGNDSLETDHTTLDGKPVGIDLAVMMAGYPGPAVLVDQQGAVVLANSGARPLLTENQGWWQDVAAWLSSAATSKAEEKPDHLVNFKRSSGTLVIGWRAVRLSGGMTLVLGSDKTPEFRLHQRLQLAAQHATSDRQLRDALTESRQRYKDLVEISSDFAWETDAEGCFVFVSPSGALGWAAAELVGRHPRENMVIDDDMPLPFESRTPVERLELWMQDADGNAACMDVSAKPLYSPSGNWLGARGVCRNLTDQVTRAAELARIRNRERALDRIVSTLRNPMAPEDAFSVCAKETAHALDACRCVIYGLEESSDTPGVVATYGEPVVDAAVPFDTVLTANEPVAVQAEDHGVLACATRFQGVVNGAVAVWRPSWNAAWDEDSSLLIAGIAERIAITHAQIAYQERLRHLSERDGLTGLYNRRAFLERLEEVLNNFNNGPSALLYMDLDNFKVLNDQRGHHQGDAALTAVAGLLRHNTRPGDIAGRMGGDEFVLWLARVSEATALAVAQRLLAGMAALEPLSVPGRPLSLSIGLAIHHPACFETFATLIERADTAMYASKQSGKNTVRLAPGQAPDAVMSAGNETDHD